jgi:hypothetical protein
MRSDFEIWLIAVAKEYWGWLPSSAVATVIGLIANVEGWTLPRTVYFGIASLGFLYSFYKVWLKEHLGNVQEPRITVEWSSGTRWYDEGPRHNDEVKIKNVGTAPAFDVRLGEFESDGYVLKWYRKIEIQVLHVGAEETVYPAFNVRTGVGESESGYMRYVLPKRTVAIPLLWSDFNGTKYTRLLTLTPGYKFLAIRVDYGSITTNRD